MTDQPCYEDEESLEEIKILFSIDEHFLADELSDLSRQSRLTRDVMSESDCHDGQEEKGLELAELMNCLSGRDGDEWEVSTHVSSERIKDQGCLPIILDDLLDTCYGVKRGQIGA